MNNLCNVILDVKDSNNTLNGIETIINELKDIENTRSLVDNIIYIVSQRFEIEKTQMFNNGCTNKFKHLTEHERLKDIMVHMYSEDTSETVYNVEKFLKELYTHISVQDIRIYG